MKFLLFLFLIAFEASASSLGVEGRVMSTPGCGNKVMVWLSLDKENYQDRLLLIHTEVPAGGSFKLYTKPGRYQLRASDNVGCEFTKKFELKDESLKQVVKLEKK